VLGDGVSLYELIAELEALSFARTRERHLAGETGINPRRTYARQPHVELAPEGAAWIEDHLQAAFGRHGMLQPATLDELDWPESF
jgi:hypothetical protein